MLNFIDTRNSYRFLKYFNYLEQKYGKNDDGLSFRDNHIPLSLTCDYDEVGEHYRLADVISTYTGICITGESGSGKKVLVQSFVQAMSYYTNNLTKIACGNLIPFVVNSLDFGDIPEVTSKSIEDYIIDEFTRYVPENPDVENPHSVFETNDVIFKRLFNNNQLVLIFENTSKLSTLSLKLFTEALDAFIRVYPNIKYLIVDTNDIGGFTKFTIEPFDIQRIKDYINLYAKNRKCDIPASERLITTIINNPKLLTMFGNPKRLKMICDLSLNNFPLHYIMLDESELKTLQTIYREMK